MKEHEKMTPHNDIIIETINKYLPKNEYEWELVGFINKDKEIFAFGNDSKIIGRLFEVVATDALINAGKELGYKLGETAEQTVYPDFYFIKPNGKRIAIDIKTTYRKFNRNGEVSKFGFTGGSFTSFMRNGTKNIDGHYNDYDGHYIIGVLYSREDEPTIGKTTLDNLENIIPAYKHPEVFIQEKYRICGDKKGSGNTDNIGTIKSNTIEPFVFGAGPFAFMGAESFHHYWTNHPRYRDSDAMKKSLYSDINSYIKWLRETKKEILLANEYEKKYNEYLKFIEEKGW